MRGGAGSFTAGPRPYVLVSALHVYRVLDCALLQVAAADTEALVGGGTLRLLDAG